MLRSVFRACRHSPHTGASAVGLFVGSLRSVLRTSFAATTIPHACILLLLCSSLAAQNVPKYDYNWIFGIYGTAPSNYYGNTQLNFLSNAPTINYFDGGMRFRVNNIAMSNAAGDLQFYFNGTTAWNKNYEVMLDSIDEGTQAINPTIPNAFLQGCIVLPYPEHDSLYMLIYSKQVLIYDTIFGAWAYGTGLRYSLIDMSGNSGLGSAVAKDVHLLDNDTLSEGRINAIKHANGRDFWVMMPRAESGYQLFLLSPNGIEYQDFQPEFDYPNGIGMMNFSPDGTKCAVWSILAFGYCPDTLVMYDFDRCTGLMSNRKEMVKEINNHYGYYGLAYSPDSRYLYWNRIDTLFQYDTYADDIYSTEVAIATSTYNGIDESVLIGFPSNAPDGKIYFCTADGIDTTFHYLSYPNRKGTEAKFCYDCVRFEKVYWFTTTHYPNYRLGPIDGSGCDTLGINNEPRANFRYDWETDNGGLVTFTDLSAYEPATWSWDFGDGTAASQDTSPVHLYAAAGLYQVCLTVSNVYGSDGFCRDVLIDSVTATTDPPLYRGISVLPNPARDVLHIALPLGALPQSVILTDMFGRDMVLPYTTGGIDIQIDVSGLPPGVYMCKAAAGGRQYQQKVVVVQ